MEETRFSHASRCLESSNPVLTHGNTWPVQWSPHPSTSAFPSILGGPQRAEARDGGMALPWVPAQLALHGHQSLSSLLQPSARSVTPTLQVVMNKFRVRCYPRSGSKQSPGLGFLMCWAGDRTDVDTQLAKPL